MANNIYRIDLLASGGNTVTVTDDGTGKDWLVIEGSYLSATDIRLNYFNSIPSSGGSGQYFTTNPNTASRLIVNGLIENVRGCDSADYIAGNEANNLIYGDQANGLGGNDTIGGGDGRDSLHGGVGLDEMIGGNGSDLMFGDDGNDTIAGGAGADTVEGGAGADSLSGGAEVGDTVSYAGSGAGVRIDITHGSVTTGLGGDAAGDQLGGFLNVTGSARNDMLTDTVKATIAFGYNDNLFDGGAGYDTLAMGGGNDTAIGGAGDDSLSGGEGRDRLIGGTGKDQLSGGAGGDHFVFLKLTDSTAVTAGRDTIRDFHHAQGDKIDLSAIDANVNTTTTNEAYSFRTAAQGFSGVAGQVTYVVMTGGVRVLADSDGNGLADFSIVVRGVAGLVAGDFDL